MQVGPGESGSNSEASFSITEDDQQPNEVRFLTDWTITAIGKLAFFPMNAE